MSTSGQNIEISDSINVVEATKTKRIDDTKLKAVLRAFVANIAIALVKFICFLFTKSSALLAEAIHSSVDSFNSICLMVGIKRGSKPADSEHPFGYGLEANVWAMFASLLMLAGTFVAIYNGFDKLINQKDILELLE